MTIFVRGPTLGTSMSDHLISALSPTADARIVSIGSLERVTTGVSSATGDLVVDRHQEAPHAPLG